MKFGMEPVAVVLLLSMMWMVGCKTADKPGVKDLRQARDAMKGATSWQSNVSINRGGQWAEVLVEKVQCPARRDLMWEVKPARETLDDKGRAIVHDIWYDGTWYTSNGKYWETYRTPEKKAAIGCGEGPLLVSGTRLFADLDETLNKGEIRVGPKMNENTYDCRWWDVADAPGAQPRYTVCINERYRLPQVMRTRELGGEYTYVFSQWDEAMVGVPPEIGR